MAADCPLRGSIFLASMSSAAPPLGSAAAPPLELEVEVPRFTGSSLAVVCVYCVLFAVAATGNLTVFVTLVRGRRYRKSRISLMIAHLAAADLVVTFIMMPLEVSPARAPPGTDCSAPTRVA
ncbi:adipokinetic hormone/corazonin-related peptide receptor variant I-like [Schistocerca nitens]|uniref:adipokinetic hormone/corazonin-related peptide receptor variant I-like n=1 Tax=Schistocerca nitens TaxID=7011 RepID=UPI002118B600|nr:adipokinetic hormone/corazonin-related peptide receptor variant I-like [Schistocerca nitens]